MGLGVSGSARPALAVVLAGALLVIGVTWPYAGRLAGPFIFDDQTAIVENTSIQSLQPSRVFAPPRETPVAARPLANLSFALDRALFGLSPGAFHGVNLAIHCVCVLWSFALLRLVLRAQALPAELRRRADGYALVAAAIFGVHPIASEVVLYATQRTETLAAACYLATVYLLAREAREPVPRWRAWPWAALVSLLGAMSKETFVTAPLVALFFDRAFFAGSFAGALRKRARFYLACSSGTLVMLLLQHGDPRPGSVRFGELDYLLAQAKIIPEYFAVAFWPAHPALDYGPLWPQSAPALAGWIALTGASIVAAGLLAFTHPKLGFLGVWVFGILAPSSSVFSIHTEVGAERRFYLPLVAVIAYAVVALASLGSRLGRQAGLGRPQLRAFGIVVGLGVVFALGARTRAHAESFASVRAAWQAAVRARPDNARAHYNLAETYRREGDVPRAIEALRAALAVRETYADAHTNLGGLLIARGDLAGGIAHVKRGVELAPRNPNARYNLALALALAGDSQAALAELEAVLHVWPDHLDARRKLAGAYLANGRSADARAHALQLLARAPEDAAARAVLATLAGQPPDKPRIEAR